MLRFNYYVIMLLDMLTALSIQDLQKEFKIGTWSKESFNLIKEAGSHWEGLRKRLQYEKKELKQLSEKTGKTVQDDEEVEKYNEKCLLLILEDWLKGKGGPEYPPTWEGLINLLNDAGISDIAEKLKKATAD